MDILFSPIFSVYDSPHIPNKVTPKHRIYKFDDNLASTNVSPPKNTLMLRSFIQILMKFQ